MVVLKKCHHILYIETWNIIINLAWVGSYKCHNAMNDQAEKNYKKQMRLNQTLNLNKTKHDK